MEIKTSWALDVGNHLAGGLKDTSKEQKIQSVLQQEYGYMSVNNHRYGFIGTYDKYYFLRRGGDDGFTRNILQVTPAVLREQSEPFTLITALAALFWKCDSKNYFYGSPYTSPAMNFRLRTPIEGVLRLKLHQLRFGRPIGGSDLGQVVKVDVSSAVQTVLKLFDPDKDPDGLRMIAFQNELSCYQDLKELQDVIIPRLHGHVVIDDWIHGLLFEELLPATLQHIKAEHDYFAAALTAMHSKGVAHGDFGLRNVMKGQDGTLRIIDFNHSVRRANVEDPEFEKACLEDFKQLEHLMQKNVE
ncbi:hypothetical protein MIR68_010107 [Amoeboaphelidium protococcarum]|nr:hypothetical protein MIR68_010107 [Amoeboaphelidium protococcarum]